MYGHSTPILIYIIYIIYIRDCGIKGSRLPTEYIIFYIYRKPVQIIKTNRLFIYIYLDVLFVLLCIYIGGYNITENYWGRHNILLARSLTMSGSNQIVDI